ncbi:BAHD acyltransferase [Cucurbita argyrosperma subsp. argyrosperma]|nr:BAHD acyltransferase [Cucurbita argyrosperma subsp. argyrosperma]
MELQILSKQIIKPSSPTPPELRRFNLSLLDQLATAGYVPLILFFANHGGAPPFEERSRRLKKSLAETLTRFYPLAGRARENSYIECNDDGAEYVEARANSVLADFLKEPMPELLACFLPIKTEAPEAADGGRMFLVQVTIFECGGMAIGVSFSHKLVDAYSISVILKTWYLAALGSDTAEAEFLQASLVPPPEGIPISVPPTDLGAKEKLASRRLVFNGSKIAALKAAAASKLIPNPTRVEAITALIWKCAMKAATKTTSSNPPTLSVMSQTVNLRKRLTPPPPEYSIGNLLGNFVSERIPPAEKTLPELVELLRDGITEFNKNGINRYEGKDAFLKIIEKLQELGALFMRDDVAFYISSSWTRFGLYEMDFGWGKPVWVSIGSIMFLNFVVLTDARDGEGIEAWVTLKEDEMGSFELDEELLDFASVNPSVVMLT